MKEERTPEMMQYEDFVTSFRPPRQILPDQAELKAALENSALDEEAEIGLSKLPPLQVLSLEEHQQATRWLRWKEALSLLRSPLLKAAVVLLLGVGVLVKL